MGRVTFVTFPIFFTIDYALYSYLFILFYNNNINICLLETNFYINESRKIKCIKYLCNNK